MSYHVISICQSMKTRALKFLSRTFPGETIKKNATLPAISVQLSKLACSRASAYTQGLAWEEGRWRVLEEDFLPFDVDYSRREERLGKPQWVPSSTNMKSCELSHCSRVWAHSWVYWVAYGVTENTWHLRAKPETKQKLESDSNVQLSIHTSDF